MVAWRKAPSCPLLSNSLSFTAFCIIFSPYLWLGFKAVHFQFICCQWTRNDPCWEGPIRCFKRDIYTGNVCIRFSSSVWERRMSYLWSVNLKLQVQEAVSKTTFLQMPDVWINLAHVYFAQGNFTLALKMVLTFALSLSVFSLLTTTNPRWYICLSSLNCSIRIACRNFSTILTIRSSCMLLGLIMKLSNGRTVSGHYLGPFICHLQIIH